jgi:nitrite reductase (NO-forming)
MKIGNVAGVAKRGLAIGTALLALAAPAVAGTVARQVANHSVVHGGTMAPSLVVADPTKLPAPINYKTPRTVEVTLVAKIVTSEILPGVTHKFMTFNGQIPAPMIRVRQGDTLKIKVINPADSEHAHSVDLHAVMGPGGGGAYTEVNPGETKTFTFKATYPGAFAYHCGVAALDEHISRGMFGMIVVEPPEGLPKVDREFYLGQHELYTKEPFGTKGEASFDGRSMVNENPSYVMFNGAVTPFLASRFGTIKANVGETVRVFLVTGGPNKTSSFHPVGNVWLRAWQEGGIANSPLKWIQTMASSPGSAFVGDMQLLVPGTTTLVDHSLSRAISKGAVAQIEAIGPENPEILSHD